MDGFQTYAFSTLPGSPLLAVVDGWGYLDQFFLHPR